MRFIAVSKPEFEQSFMKHLNECYKSEDFYFVPEDVYEDVTSRPNVYFYIEFINKKLHVLETIDMNTIEDQYRKHFRNYFVTRNEARDALNLIKTSCAW